jgi:hypothetical protein
MGVTVRRAKLGCVSLFAAQFATCFPCAQWFGVVQGPNYEDSVRRLQLRLPAMLYDIQVAIRHPSIQQASSYYGQFTTYIRSLCGGEKLKKSADSATLSTLAAVTSVPLTPFRDPVSAAASVVTSEPPTPDETPGEWDIVVEGSGEGVEVEMDWDISVEDSGQAVSDAVGTSTAFAAVQDALDQLPVQKLTDDILELQAFLTQVRCKLVRVWQHSLRACAQL